MNILFLDAYFEPEQTSFTHLEKDLLNRLAESGHKTSIICPTPTRGIERETAKAYRSRKNESVLGGSVNVLRFFAPFERKNPVLRAIRYFWCNLRTYQEGKKIRNTDVVFANSTPPTQGFIAAKVAKKLNVPFVFSLQDIFPDSLVNAGMTGENSLLYKIGRKIENYTYRHADKIIVISESFKQNIMAKGVPEGKIAVIPNWIDSESVKQVLRKDNRLFDEYSINRDKFVVLYAGNFGASQGTGVIINAADILKNNSDIQFVLFGGGSEYEKAIKQITAKGLSNITINPLLPAERIPEVYSMGDVALITCKRGVGKASMPSKTFSIMACNTPIIASFDTGSELADVLKESGAGICIEPENPKALAQAIKEVYDKSLAFKGGREFVKSNADKSACVQKYASIICDKE